LAGSTFGSVIPNLVVIIKAKVLVKPLPTPPVPAKALSIPRPHEMPLHLLLYPILDTGEAHTRIPYPEVVNPAPEFGLIKAMTLSTGGDT
jgi:hypothetical protein